MTKRRKILASSIGGLVLATGITVVGIAQSTGETVTVPRADVEAVIAELESWLTTTTTLPPTTTTTVPPTTTTTLPPTTTTTLAPTTTTLPPTTTTTAPPAACVGTQVAAGANLVTVANSQAAGATFCLAAGTYNVTAAIPMQPGDKWVGALGPNNARLSILTGSDTTSEMNVGNVSGVTLRNVIVERFNPPDAGGRAAVRAANDWVIENAEVRNNTHAGIYHADRAQIRNSFIHHNGRYGITGFQADDAVIEGNTVSFNNTQGFNDADQGGAKWTGTTNQIIRNNHFHSNFHAGIWLDANHHNTLIEGNRVENNTWHGIHFEISCSGIIRGNTVTGNGQTGIFVNASQNVVVEGNTLNNNKDSIRVWAQDRGDGECNWIAANVRVEGNDVTMDEGFVGLQNGGQGSGIFTSGSIRFVDNDYHVPNVTGTWFHWQGSLRTFSAWQGFGQDLTGSID